MRFRSTGSTVKANHTVLYCSYQEEAKPLIPPLHVKNYLGKVSIFDVLSDETKRVLADW